MKKIITIFIIAFAFAANGQFNVKVNGNGDNINKLQTVNYTIDTTYGIQLAQQTFDQFNYYLSYRYKVIIVNDPNVNEYFFNTTVLKFNLATPFQSAIDSVFQRVSDTVSLNHQSW